MEKQGHLLEALFISEMQWNAAKNVFSTFFRIVLWMETYPLGLPFRKSCFPEKICIRGDRINLSIYIPSEISGSFG